MEHSLSSVPACERRRVDRGHGDLGPAQIRTGVGLIPGFLAGPRLQVCMSFN